MPHFCFSSSLTISRVFLKAVNKAGNHATDFQSLLWLGAQKDIALLRRLIQVYLSWTPWTDQPLQALIKKSNCIPELVSNSFLTIGLVLPVEQDALYRSPDENSTARLLNDIDDVEGKLTGAPPWVVRTTLVVLKKESIDQKAGVFRRDTWNYMK